MTDKTARLKGIDVLVFEDDPMSLDVIRPGLEGMGAGLFVAQNIGQAMSVLLQTHIEVIIAAIDLVDEQCIEMIKDYKAQYPETLFYVLAGQEYNSVESSQESVRLVVDDYIKKPLDIVHFAKMVETATGRLHSENRSLTVVDPLVAKVKPYFIFRSPVMRRALHNITEISASRQTVLISGETGTGKEIVARAVHVLSPRSSHPFVAINCGAIPESLIEGELFGHERGAFTGAVKMRKGKFETANYGTLFLDEIGDMPLNLQTRLLRVLEEGNVYRVGGESAIPIDVRVIAASHQDLREAVRDGLFRQDLYYRLNILRLHLPPLRERIEDIALLAVHFLDRAFTEMGRSKPYPSLSSETIYLLEHYPWKGNIRELRNIMTRIATMLPPDTKRIFPFHILPHLDDMENIHRRPETEKAGEGLFVPPGTNLRDVEDLMIQQALRITDGNRTQAAKLLGISLRTLRRKLNTPKPT